MCKEIGLYRRDDDSESTVFVNENIPLPGKLLLILSVTIFFDNRAFNHMGDRFSIF